MRAPDDPCQTPPSLSVIIACYNSRSTLDDCLSSLRRQQTSRGFEVILVESSADGTVDHVRREYPEVRVVASARRLYCGDARNLALQVARAPIVAFLDADCHVGPDWVEAVLEAHRSPYLLVGGTVDNGSRNSVTAWAYYFCEFSLWLPGTKPKEIGEIAGCCLSLKREAFERYGPFLAGTYCSDTAFQWRARQDGHKVLSSPAIRVYHTCESSLAEFLAHVVEHRRFFIRVARHQGKLEGWRRWAAVTASPLYPFLLLALTAGRVIRCPRYLVRFLLSSPLVFLGCCARAWGELTGLLTGPRASDLDASIPAVR